MVGSAETEELIQPFKDDMEEFIWFCKISLEELQGNIADGKADFAEQVQYYRFRLKSPNTPPGAKDFFGVWAKFLAHFETVSLPVPCTYTLFCHFSLSFFSYEQAFMFLFFLRAHFRLISGLVSVDRTSALVRVAPLSHSLYRGILTPSPFASMVCRSTKGVGESAAGSCSRHPGKSAGSKTGDS